MGSIESQWLVSGFGAWDLSENNLIYGHGFENPLSVGGNPFMTTAYLVRGDGPISESDDPYEGCNGSYYSGLTPLATVTDMRVLPEDPNVIKQFLYDYGAIYTGYYHNSEFYDDSTTTYYYDGPDTNTNHSVLLVGWDDHKPTAGGKGAWIAKNSWGKDFGEDGYFYMSYNNHVGPNRPVYWPRRINYHENMTIHCYDKLGNTHYWGYGWSNPDYTDYGLIKFMIPQNNTVTKLGTWIRVSDSKVSFKVYDHFENNSLSGLLRTIHDKSCDYPGYYTFDLPTSIAFTDTNDIYIKVKYYSPDTDFPIPVEHYVENNDGKSIYADPEFEFGNCWISDTGNPGTWAVNKTGPGEFDLCIKAYSVSGGTDVADQPSETVPQRFELLQNYPNPFNASTTISFRLPHSAQVTVSIYNVKGQLVETFVDRQFEMGARQVVWHANDVGAGMYVYRLTAGDYTAIGKCLLLK